MHAAAISAKGSVSFKTLSNDMEWKWFKAACQQSVKSTLSAENAITITVMPKEASASVMPIWSIICRLTINRCRSERPRLMMKFW